MHYMTAVSLEMSDEPLFVYLIIKFFAKFIHGTENFCNFVGGNHERILLFDFISNWKSPIKVQTFSHTTNSMTKKEAKPLWFRFFCYKNS